MTPKGNYSKAAPADGADRPVAPGLAGLLAEAGPDIAGRADNPRRLMLRAVVDELARRAGPDHPAVVAVRRLDEFDSGDSFAPFGTALRDLPTLELAATLAELAMTRDAAARASGAVATPPALADLLAGWAIRDGAATVLDPACGAGMLLARAAAWRAWLGGAPSAALWGVEAEPETAALARLALAACGAAGARVLTADFLDLLPGLPDQVAAVVANPPFVRHERLADQPGRRRRRPAAPLRRPGRSARSLLAGDHRAAGRWWAGGGGHAGELAGGRLRRAGAPLPARPLRAGGDRRTGGGALVCRRRHPRRRRPGAPPRRSGRARRRPTSG